MAVPVEQWIAVRRLLNQSRGPLSLLAARRYPASRLVVGAPFLALSVPSEPVPVDELRLSWGPSPAFSLPVPDFLPAGFSSYSAAIEGLDPPAVFENRAGHRLLDVSDKHLTFGPGSYFDALDTTEAMGEVINVGGDEPTTILRLAIEVQRAMGLSGPLRATFKPYEEIGGRYQDVRCRIPDTSKAARLLGLRQTMSLPEGLVHTVAWHRERRGVAATVSSEAINAA